MEEIEKQMKESYLPELEKMTVLVSQMFQQETPAKGTFEQVLVKIIEVRHWSYDALNIITEAIKQQKQMQDLAIKSNPKVEETPKKN